MKGYMKKILILLILILSIKSSFVTYGQVWNFDMTKPQPKYNDEVGYGYDRNTSAVSEKQKHPMFFSVKYSYKIGII